MEFPRLGQHCNEPSCQQLDFLPMKCDACLKIYCRDHIVYTTHNCPESYRKDNQIPVCPLCNAPCPIKKGELPDVIVGRHIEADCLSDPAKERRKVYTNKCSRRGCKQKELVPVKCESCRLNFCLRHRHEQDHDCQGFSGTGKTVSNAGAAAISRFSQSSSKKPHPPAAAASSAVHSPTGNTNRNNSSSSRIGVTANLSTLQGSLSEDEALARALQMSLNEGSPETSSHPETMTEQEREDFLLAQALAASEQETSGQPHNQQTRVQRTIDRCALQ